jgi:phage/plasmid-like protein (TIGR03299 family)
MHGIHDDYAVFGSEKPAWHNIGIVPEAKDEHGNARPLTLKEINEHMPNGIATVTKEPIWISAGAGHPEQPVSGMIEDYDGPVLVETPAPGYVEVPGQYCTVATWRDESRTSLHAGMSDKYEVFQDRAVLEDIPRQLVEEGEAAFESVFYLHGGKKFVALLKLAGNVTINDGSLMQPYLMVMNSHDASSKLTIKLVTVRVVCANTLAVGLSEQGAEMRIRHSRQIHARAQAATEALGLARKSLDLQVTEANRMVEHTVNINQENAYYSEVFGFKWGADKEDITPHQNKIRREIESARRWEEYRKLRNPEHGGADYATVWGMLNSVTRYADHHKTVRSMGATQEEAKVKANLLGTGNALKQRAWNSASKIVRPSVTLSM